MCKTWPAVVGLRGMGKETGKCTHTMVDVTLITVLYNISHTTASIPSSSSLLRVCTCIIFDSQALLFSGGVKGHTHTCCTGGESVTKAIKSPSQLTARGRRGPEGTQCLLRASRMCDGWIPRPLLSVSVSFCLGSGPDPLPWGCSKVDSCPDVVAISTTVLCISTQIQVKKISNSRWVYSHVAIGNSIDGMKTQYTLSCNLKPSTDAAGNVRLENNVYTP